MKLIRFRLHVPTIDPVSLAYLYMLQLPPPLCLLRLLTPHRHQSSHNKILPLKPLLPATQRLHLLCSQPIQRIQFCLQILRQHILIEATTRQSSTRVSARKVGVRAAGTVEVLARRDVEDSAADGKVDGWLCGAVVREQGWWCEGAKEDGWWGWCECGN